MKIIPLRCPTCGANVTVEGDAQKFTCAHCGTSYWLEQKAQKLPPAEREKPRPTMLSTERLGQWLRAGDYEIFVHQLQDTRPLPRRVLYAEVEYRNPSAAQLSCRRNQWVLFDSQGYTYDPITDTALFADPVRPPLTGERFLAPGRAVRGWLAFVIPLPCTVARLQFITGFLGTKSAEFVLQPA